MKQRVVVFNQNGFGARILTNPSQPPPPGAIVNPDLSFVQGISPSYWKRVGDSIVPMVEEEIITADREIAFQKELAHNDQFDTLVKQMSSIEIKHTDTLHQLLKNKVEISELAAKLEGDKSALIDRIHGVGEVLRKDAESKNKSLTEHVAKTFDPLNRKFFWITVIVTLSMVNDVAMWVLRYLHG